MTRSWITAALFALPLAVQSSPLPQTSPNTHRLAKRLEDGVDCSGSSVDVPEHWTVCVGSDGYNLSCDDCNSARTDQGVMCWAASVDSALGTRIACPADDGPLILPDGSKPDYGEGGEIASAFCGAQGGGGVFGPLATVGCMAWTFVAAGTDTLAQNQAGVTMLCDTFLVGLCTAIDSGLFDIPETPCVDDPDGPNPDLCSFAGPGKKA